MRRKALERKYSRRTEVWKNDVSALADSYEIRIARLTALVEGYKRNSVNLSVMYKKRICELRNDLNDNRDLLLSHHFANDFNCKTIVKLNGENSALKEQIKELEAKLKK